MRVVILGATGFIGRALSARLLRDGANVVGISRDPARARGLLGDEVELASMDQLARAVDGADVVVNLAGENVLARRWSARRKEKLRASRVDVTRDVVAALGRASARPKALISASAVGFYGEGSVDEKSPRGPGFLAALCADWEDAATHAEELGVRVALPRIGVVLGAEGGVWPALRMAFASGFGGTLGAGEQWTPWVHLDDVVEALTRAISDPSLRGTFNVTAPRPATNLDLSRTVAARLHRSLGPRVPSWLLRLTLGERAQAIFASQRVEPRVLLERGFNFRHAEVSSAVDALLDLERSVEIAATAPGQYTLTQVTDLDASRDDVFAHFSRAQNLGPMTPAWTEFRFLGAPPARVQDGTTIDYRLSLGPVPVRWRTIIEHWQAGVRFVDSQARGPYRKWRHEHRFEAIGQRTRMFDIVHYALPLGWLGRAAHGLFVSHLLRRIFGFRRAAMGFRFGLREKRAERSAA